MDALVNGQPKVVFVVFVPRLESAIEVISLVEGVARAYVQYRERGVLGGVLCCTNGLTGLAVE